ncbi:MAG: DNA repair protein RadC [Saprospiraceae bacterium]|nr:DNA repair protein RadC [Saprospiraceae bacterium]
MSEKSKDRLAITSWSSDDQPRYKLMHHGSHALSDSELLAILIVTGIRGQSAVDLGKCILRTVDGDFDKLARMNVKELMQFNGIGEAKAISILAALELGRRRLLGDRKIKVTVSDSKSAYDAMAPLLMDKPHEEFWLLLLSRSNQIIDRFCLSKGGISGTVVDPKLVFKKALEHLASGVILYHNHPSGQLKPSQADIDLTLKLKNAGDLLDIKVLDHLIITPEGYLSFADESLMP